jgi:4-hydroxybenzoate polyprenyltransferase
MASERHPVPGRLPAPGGAPVLNAARRLALIGDAVMFRHTLFSLPFALSAALLESSGRPPLNKLILILIAAAAGRNAANALKRVIDAGIDGRNPRTAARHIPSGLLSKRELLVTAILLFIILVIAAALLGPLCAALLPLAVFLTGVYSFSKRFTWACHYWLGIACSCAPMGAFIALSGRFEPRYFVLAAAHALWVAGFDIIYALPDIRFDRLEGLHSIPARFGAPAARVIAALSHAAACLCMVSLPRFWPISPVYYVFVIASAALLAAEHIIALRPDERHIRLASYSINEIVPLILLAGIALSSHQWV